jgi:hypothetical protein
MIDERPRALAVTLAIGALTRESAMFLIPLAYAIWAERLIDVDALRRVAIVSAPAIAIYLALRLGIPTVDARSPATAVRCSAAVSTCSTTASTRSPRAAAHVHGLRPLWFIAPCVAQHAPRRSAASSSWRCASCR